MNVHDERDRLALMERCAYEAVRATFSHLSVAQIRNPPRPWFDAKFARQIVIRIMNVDFDAPRRRLSIMAGRRRAAIAFAIEAVDRRLECDVFRASYERMAAHALTSYGRRVELG